MRHSFLLTAAAVLSFGSMAAVAQTPVSPSQINQVVTFGDSLSDTGNASIATFGLVPGPGYAPGELTNPQVPPGPAGLWIDQFAAMLGTSSTPALAGGTNFAVASALTGSANLQDMQNQVNLFSLENLGHAGSNNLYTFWGGANDVLSGQNPVAAANNISSEIQQIAAEGGHNFLWLNLPDLGSVPDLNGNVGQATLADLGSHAFNATWATDLANLDALGINVIGVNVEDLFASILANPAAYGFTNVTTACDATAGCNPNSALFWDGLHPTTYADSLVATLAYNDLTGASVTATPEPSSFILLGSSLLACVFFYRRRLLAVR